MRKTRGYGYLKISLPVYKNGTLEEIIEHEFKDVLITIDDRRLVTYISKTGSPTTPENGTPDVDGCLEITVRSGDASKTSNTMGERQASNGQESFPQIKGSQS